MKVLLERSCCRNWQNRNPAPGSWFHVAGVINNLTDHFPEVVKTPDGEVLHLEMLLKNQEVIEKIARIKGVFQIQLDASEAQQLKEVIL